MTHSCPLSLMVRNTAFSRRGFGSIPGEDEGGEFFHHVQAQHIQAWTGKEVSGLESRFE